MKYPLFLIPEYKEYLWGGKKLIKEYGKKCDMDSIAESWELSCHDGGISEIENGKHKGETLLSYIEKYGKDVLGENCKEAELPILTKFIDSEKSLSVQVHPGEEYAMSHEGDHGKTELWYIADCKEGATVYFGLARDTDKEEFLKKAKDGSITELLNKTEVKKGDVFLITPGIVHAIGADMTVTEIGTSSNITYRIYDFDRRDKNGNLRELHLDKAADVIKFEKSQKSSFDNNGMLDCGCFKIIKKQVSKKEEMVCGKESFMHILVLEGNLKFIYNGEEYIAEKGKSIFIPAGMGSFFVDGTGEMIITEV